MTDVMRCFVAVWPSPDVVDALAALPRPVAEGLRWSSKDQWHVTLRFFGELNDRALTDASAALVRAAAGLPSPLIADGGPCTRFLGPGLVVWPVEGLSAAATSVEQMTTAIGKPPPARDFYGHITLARGRQGLDLRRATELLTPLATSWAAASLTLVASELHPEGARYRVMQEFSLPPSA